MAHGHTHMDYDHYTARPLHGRESCSSFAHQCLSLWLSAGVSDVFCDVILITSPHEHSAKQLGRFPAPAPRHGSWGVPYSIFRAWCVGVEIAQGFRVKSVLVVQV